MIYDDPSLVEQDKIDDEINVHNMWTLHAGRGYKKKGCRCRLEGKG